jgi:hypothetical protein
LISLQLWKLLRLLMHRRYWSMQRIRSSASNNDVVVHRNIAAGLPHWCKIAGSGSKNESGRGFTTHWTVPAIKNQDQLIKERGLKTVARIVVK